MARRPSSQYMRRARAYADAVDLGIAVLDSHAGEVPDMQDGRVRQTWLEWQEMALNPAPQHATVRGLASLEEAYFTYWQEAQGAHVERFWSLVAERGLPFRRHDHVRNVLQRGRIQSRAEYDAVTDAIVIHQQLGIITAEEATDLGGMLGRFEARRKRT